MDEGTGLTPVMRFCCHCHCGCVELFVEAEAPEGQRIVITDDFGQRIQMSVDQLRTIVRRAQSGAIAEALSTTMS